MTSVGAIDPGAHRLTLYQGGWQAYVVARATEQRHAEEAHLAYSTERDRLIARARKQRQWATTGVAKAAKAPKDNDKAQRDFRLNRTENKPPRSARPNVPSSASQRWKSPSSPGCCVSRWRQRL